MHSRSFRKVVIVTISLQNFMKLAIFNLHMLYFQCVKGIKETQKMSSINAIGSQVNFTGAKKSSKNADKQNIKELGGRSFEEKYSIDGKPVNVTTANAGILFKDYIIDHLIEYAVAGVTFVAVALKGKKLMSGVSSGIFDAAKQITQKNGDSLNAVKKFTTYIETAKKNIINAKNTKANNIANSLQEAAKANAKKTVMEGSVIDKIAKKADDNNSIVSKFIKKVTKNPEAGSKEVAKFFAKDLGITRGADAVDNITALGVAGVAANIAKNKTDEQTDKNDLKIAEKAQNANHQNLEKAKRAASIVLNAL